mgnify:CR=1 FL=1
MESINSVNVLSIDEERLKFRVIVGVDASAGNAVPQDLGRYKFDLPPLTAFGNSTHYKQCHINLDGISCTAQSAVGAANEAVAWTNGIATGKVAALEVSLDVPSSGTLSNNQILAAEAGTGTNAIGRFMQLVPVQANLVGNNAGTRVSDVGGNDIGLGSYAWQGNGLGEAIMCANPFGSTCQFSFKRPDSAHGTRLFIADVGNPAIDVGIYSLQFTITMIPNK